MWSKMHFLLSGFLETSGCGILVKLPAFRHPSVCSSTDRASDYGSEGWGFESLQAHQKMNCVAIVIPNLSKYTLLGSSGSHSF